VQWAGWPTGQDLGPDDRLQHNCRQLWLARTSHHRRGHHDRVDPNPRGARAPRQPRSHHPLRPPLHRGRAPAYRRPAVARSATSASGAPWPHTAHRPEPSSPRGASLVAQRSGSQHLEEGGPAGRRRTAMPSRSNRWRQSISKLPDCSRTRANGLAMPGSRNANGRCRFPRRPWASSATRKRSEPNMSSGIAAA